jgi:hypothetical protein
LYLNGYLNELNSGEPAKLPRFENALKCEPHTPKPSYPKAIPSLGTGGSAVARLLGAPPGSVPEVEHVQIDWLRLTDSTSPTPAAAHL